MRLKASQFRDSPNRAVTLLGMSGVGKTTFASKLPRTTWFNYSGDYRIGTRYLEEHILDEIKRQAMTLPYLRDLLLGDSIYIRSNITTEHLHPISCFLGKIGNPELGGLDVDEFKRRQALFRRAEVQAMKDVPMFMDKARNIYGYPHFLNDAGGSVCGLTDDECWTLLAEKTVIVYLHASDEMEKTLLERATLQAKPLHYESDFLDDSLARYLEEQDLKSTDEIVPDDFVKWVFPSLVKYRKPQYERIAEKFGYTIEAEKIFDLRDESDMLDLLCDSMST